MGHHARPPGARARPGGARPALVHVSAAHGALLALDEAHAVLGPAVDPGRAADHHGVTVLRIGTLSEALGSLGGFVAGPRRYVDRLRTALARLPIP